MYVTFWQIIVLCNTAVLYPVLIIQSNAVQSRHASLQGPVCHCNNITFSVRHQCVPV